MKLLLNMIEDTKQHLKEATDKKEEHQWMLFVTYVTISYVLSLRRSEGFLLDLKGLHANWSRNVGSYFIVALLGKIKGEKFDRAHLIPCSNTTSSGIKVKEIVEKLMKNKSACF